MFLSGRIGEFHAVTDPTSSPPSRQFRLPPAAVAAAVFLWAFTFRLLQPNFTNDDFDHLSKARQVLAGELPYRDFYDDGRPLTIAASAIAQYVSPTLLSEVVLRGGCIAIGVSLVYALTHAVTQSTALGLVAALLTSAMRPRLYNYPKVLLFPLLLWLILRYARGPTRSRLTVLALFTVVAFLFRYDFVVYAGTTGVAALLMVHRRAAWRPLLLYAGIMLAAVAPFLVWLALNGAFTSTGSTGVRSLLSSAPGVTSGPLHFSWGNGPFSIEPPPPQIGVRWAASVEEDTRHALERRYGLQERERKADGRSFRYYIEAPSRDRVLALISDPRVEDTSGIDRSSGVLLEQPFWDRVLTAYPILRLRFSAVFGTREDAQAWIYLIFILSVPLSVLLLWRGPTAWGSPEATVIASGALLAAMLHQFLVQGNLDSRLPDVTGPTAVLLAWCASSLLVMAGRWSVAPRAARAMTAVVLLVPALLTWQAVGVYAGSVATALTASAPSPRRVAMAVSGLAGSPLNYVSADSDLVRYLATCTTPADRVLLVAFAPEVYYLSERLFAGGMNKFDFSGFNWPSAEVMKRLRHQSVPLVIVADDHAEFLHSEWGELSEYIDSKYREVAHQAFRFESRKYRILLDRQRQPMGFTADSGLPCFVARDAAALAMPAR